MQERESSSNNVPAPRRRLEFVLVAILVALAVGLAVSAVLAYRLQQQAVLAQANAQLAAIADLKIHDLGLWRDERLADAEMVTGNAAFARLVTQAIDGSTPATADLASWVARLQQSGAYDRVTVLDAEGREVVSAPETSQPVSSEVRSRIPALLSSGKATFVDFHRYEGTGKIYLGVLAPIIDSSSNDRPLGAVYFRVDPRVALYPSLRTWPVPSDTAETLLVRRDGSNALFLNPLRFDAGAALNASVPLDAPRRTPAAMAVSGYEGNYRGPDYRGVDVLSALRRVPGSNWFLVARQDAAEALSPHDSRIWQLLLILAALLASVALAFAFVQRRRDMRFLQGRVDAEAERSWLLDVLASSLSEIWVFDAETLKVTFVNQSALRNVGYTLDELSEMTPSDIEPDFETQDLASLASAAETGAAPTVSFERIHRRKDGSTYPASVTFSRMDSGTREVFLAVAEDVTERALAATALRESETLLVASQRAAAVGHYVLHIDENRWTSSEVLGEILGLEMADERTLEDWVETLHPEDREAVLAHYQNDVLRDHKPFSYDYRVVRQNDGAVRWIRGLGSLEFDESGEPITMFGVMQDVTERKLAELEVQRVHSELEQIVADRTAQLEAANHELEAFSYSVSHDLRAPLRHVSGFVELLGQRERDRLSEKGIHYLDVIADSVSQMGILIDDLLQFSRVGRAEMVLVDVDMGELARETADTLKQGAGDHAVEWDIQQLPHVRGDRATLRLVWANLLGNAVKYSRKRAIAHVAVSAQEAADEVVFSVSDDGVGFDMAYAGKLFGVFQRLHSTADFEGTGIGLANVSRIVSRHGGRVWAEAEVDRGATFHFSIPKKG